MGHGRGISLKEPMDPESNPEKIEILTLWLIDKIPMYWYKCLILSLTGLVGVILPSILLWVYGHELLALAVLLGGFIGKPLGYIIGWEIFPKHTVRTEEENQKIVWQENTAIGELLTGFFNKLPIFYGYFVLTLGVILG